MPPPGHPRITLVSGGNLNFRFSNENGSMPTMDSFLQPLDLVDSITPSQLNPDFIVLHMPATVLHHATISRLNKSIMRLIEQRQVVRITIQSLEAYKIPQNRSLLILMASPYPSLATVPMGRPLATPGYQDIPAMPDRIESYIGDLSFNNPREDNSADGAGFVCITEPEERHGARPAPKNIYNHCTGENRPGIRPTVDMEARTVSLGHRIPQHPGECGINCQFYSSNPFS
jgi:hypothetical protein